MGGGESDNDSSESEDHGDDDEVEALGQTDLFDR